MPANGGEARYGSTQLTKDHAPHLQMPELHADACNLFNTPQFTNPGGDLNSPATFGKITSTKQFTSRQIQLAARFVF